MVARAAGKSVILSFSSLHWRSSPMEPRIDPVELPGIIQHLIFKDSSILVLDFHTIEISQMPNMNLNTKNAKAA